MPNNQQEIIFKKIRKLIPNAKYSVRPYANNDNLAKNPVRRGDWLIDWHESNAAPCPNLAEIDAVTEQSVEDNERNLLRQQRIQEAKSNLALKALYRNQLKSEPDLTFAQFIRALEELVIS